MKKITPLLFIFLSFCALSVQSNTTICPVRDNKKAVYTFTADDGFTNAAVFFNNEFKRLDICGSLALVAKWINGTQTPASTYEFWNSILADGRIDVINHSKSHVKFSTISSNPSGQDSLFNEINGNQSVFRAKFPGQDIITMANPAVVNTDAADLLIKQSHYAARNGSSGYNPLSPTETQWFKLNMLANYFASKSRAAYSTEINKYIDNVIASKQWLILLAHGIGTGANAMQDTAFTRHFEYVASKKSDLWIARFGDVTRYFREKQNATLVTTDSTAARIAISLTHNLDARIFNYPLTLKTKVPASWTTITVTQGTTVVTVKPVIESGLSYAIYNALPNAGPVVLTPQLPNSLASTYAKPFVAFHSDTSSLVFGNLPPGDTSVSVYDASGRTFHQLTVSTHSPAISFSAFPKGIYLAKCQTPGGDVSGFKFFKK